MVEDSITDGKRIAQLLASEVTGLETGALASLAVADADPDATPSEDGTIAYRIEADGDEIAAVWLFPSRAEIQFSVEPAATDRGPAVEERAVTLTSGAAVKSAVDLLRATASERGD